MSGKAQRRTLSYDEWMAEGTALFGSDQMQWKFQCPSCGTSASPEDWKRVGAKEGEVAFSCIGRHMPDLKAEIFERGHGPCNYAGGGLFKLNPLTVTDKCGKTHTIFDFARPAA